jgi:hypothetical protein
MRLLGACSRSQKNRNARRHRHRSLWCTTSLSGELLEARHLLAADVLFNCDPVAIHFADDLEPVHVLWAPDTQQALIDEQESGYATAGADINTVDGSRWISTATNGGGLGQGHPSTITWSVVPDGTSLPTAQHEPAAGSDLRARLDALYGSVNNWLPVLQKVFDSWEAVSGIDFVYEQNDDGAAYGHNSRGVLGVRGDVRIGGHTIDGNHGILAYNYFPNHGDMVLDTADSYFSNLSNNSLRLRNTMAHELGHGLGLDHALPKSGTKLMEPSITTGYDGPQHDDILRINRGYGDRLEGNDTAAAAFDLGALSAAPTVVTDVSIDDDSDVDYFHFTIASNSAISLTLSPFGLVYTVGLEDGSTASFDSRAQSDLSLTVLTSNAATVLANANLAGLGGAETLAGLSLAAGQYLLRVTGAQNATQMYTLSAASIGGGGNGGGGEGGSDTSVPTANQPPVLATIGDRTIASATQNGVISLSASDPNADALTYTVSGQIIEYYLDQTLGLNSPGSNEYLNWGGRGEKWFNTTSGAWYYITPDGKLYRWLGGSLANDPVVEQLATAAFANTALLHNAAANTPPATLSVSGNTLTINPNDTFTGRFAVTVTVSDGRGGIDSETLFVTVASAIGGSGGSGNGGGGGGGDTTAPTITAYSPAPSSTISTAATNIDVTFSEAVSGVDASDLVLSGTGAAAAVKSAPVNIGTNTWRFAVSNLQSGSVNVSLAPHANDIEDAAGNDVASVNWSFTVSIATANQQPVLAPIGDRTVASATQNSVIWLSASDPNGDALTYSVTAQSIEYTLDQALGLASSGGNEYLNWGGRGEKWLNSASGTWYYITPDGKLYRWLGGSLASDPLVEQLSSAVYANTALLHNAAADNPPATFSLIDNTLTIDPQNTFSGRFAVTVTVSDGRGGTDHESFFVTVL